MPNLISKSFDKINIEFQQFKDNQNNSREQFFKSKNELLNYVVYFFATIPHASFKTYRKIRSKYTPLEQPLQTENAKSWDEVNPPMSLKAKIYFAAKETFKLFIQLLPMLLLELGLALKEVYTYTREFITWGYEKTKSKTESLHESVKFNISLVLLILTIISAFCIPIPAGIFSSAISLQASIVLTIALFIVTNFAFLSKKDSKEEVDSKFIVATSMEKMSFLLLTALTPLISLAIAPTNINAIILILGIAPLLIMSLYATLRIGLKYKNINKDNTSVKDDTYKLTSIVAETFKSNFDVKLPSFISKGTEQGPTGPENS